MVMSDKYHDYTACNDVCSSLRIAFENYRLGEYDAETKQIISYYQFLSDSIKFGNKQGLLLYEKAMENNN